MTVTVFAPFTLASGKTEADLMAASARFQRDFVRHQPGILRRELARKSDGTYVDIVQFRSQSDLEAVVAAEAASPDCAAFFAVMDMAAGSEHEVCTSLETYTNS